MDGLIDWSVAGDISRAAALTLAAATGAVAVGKARQRWVFAATIYSWHIFTLRQARSISLFVPAIELALAVALVIVVTIPFAQRGAPYAYGAAVALFLAFVGTQAYLVLRRPGASCGCVGRTTTVGKRSFANALSFAGLAVVALLFHV